MLFGKVVKRKKTVLSAWFALLLLMGYGYVGKSVAGEPTTVFKDRRDGKKYNIVTIGDQTWMAKNLNYAAESSVCYENKAGNCTKYGRLYSWDAAKNACPAGWHFASSAEWTTLIESAGGSSVAGKRLKSMGGWYDKHGKSSGISNGTDIYGFSALPGGYGYNGEFRNAGYYGYWWNVTEVGTGFASSRSMDHYNDNVFKATRDKSYLFSVRCVAD